MGAPVSRVSRAMRGQRVDRSLRRCGDRGMAARVQPGPGGRHCGESGQTQGGLRAPSPGYLGALRDAAHAHGALLVFDEVITLRLARGGGQICSASCRTSPPWARSSAAGCRWAVSAVGQTSCRCSPTSSRRCCRSGHLQRQSSHHGGRYRGDAASRYAGLRAPGATRQGLGESIVDASRQAGVGLQVTQIEVAGRN